MLKKIFPAGVGNTPYNSFKLVLISEGYLAPESSQFIADCVSIFESLLNMAPFNRTRVHPHWLSVYAGFVASAYSGPSIDAPAPAGRTAFESSFDSVTGLLTVNQAKLNGYVAAETFPYGSASLPLADSCAQGYHSAGQTCTLLVLLLPSITGYPAGGELECVPGANDYYFIASSNDGLCYQILARTLASCLGLGDEFEFGGAMNLAPADSGVVSAISFNLQYFDSSPPNPLDGKSRWFQLFSLAQQGVPPKIHPKLDPSTPDTSLDVPPADPEGVEFWEGGSGYRTKIWRSAHDCLMRRRIGDSNFPVRTNPVPFCLACRQFLSSLIG